MPKNKKRQPQFNPSKKIAQATDDSKFDEYAFDTTQHDYKLQQQQQGQQQQQQEQQEQKQQKPTNQRKKSSTLPFNTNPYHITRSAIIQEIRRQSFYRHQLDLQRQEAYKRQQRQEVQPAAIVSHKHRQQVPLPLSATLQASPLQTSEQQQNLAYSPSLPVITTTAQVQHINPYSQYHHLVNANLNAQQHIPFIRGVPRALLPLFHHSSLFSQTKICNSFVHHRDNIYIGDNNQRSSTTTKTVNAIKDVISKLFSYNTKRNQPDNRLDQHQQHDINIMKKRRASLSAILPTTPPPPPSDDISDNYDDDYDERHNFNVLNDSSKHNAITTTTQLPSYSTTHLSPHLLTVKQVTHNFEISKELASTPTKKYPLKKKPLPSTDQSTSDTTGLNLLHILQQINGKRIIFNPYLHCFQWFTPNLLYPHLHFVHYPEDNALRNASNFLNNRNHLVAFAPMNDYKGYMKHYVLPSIQLFYKMNNNCTADQKLLNHYIPSQNEHMYQKYRQEWFKIVRVLTDSYSIMFEQVHPDENRYSDVISLLLHKYRNPSPLRLLWLRKDYRAVHSTSRQDLSKCFKLSHLLKTTIQQLHSNEWQWFDQTSQSSTPSVPSTYPSFMLNPKTLNNPESTSASIDAIIAQSDANYINFMKKYMITQPSSSTPSSASLPSSKFSLHKLHLMYYTRYTPLKLNDVCPHYDNYYAQCLLRQHDQQKGQQTTTNQCPMMKSNNNINADEKVCAKNNIPKIYNAILHAFSPQAIDTKCYYEHEDSKNSVDPTISNNQVSTTHITTRCVDSLNRIDKWLSLTFIKQHLYCSTDTNNIDTTTTATQCTHEHNDCRSKQNRARFANDLADCVKKWNLNIDYAQQPCELKWKAAREHSIIVGKVAHQTHLLHSLLVHHKCDDFNQQNQNDMQQDQQQILFYRNTPLIPNVLHIFSKYHSPKHYNDFTTQVHLHETSSCLSLPSTTVASHLSTPLSMLFGSTNNNNITSTQRLYAEIHHKNGNNTKSTTLFNNKNINYQIHDLLRSDSGDINSNNGDCLQRLTQLPHFIDLLHYRCHTIPLNSVRREFQWNSQFYQNNMMKKNGMMFKQFLLDQDRELERHQQPTEAEIRSNNDDAQQHPKYYYKSIHSLFTPQNLQQTKQHLKKVFDHFPNNNADFWFSNRSYYNPTLGNVLTKWGYYYDDIEHIHSDYHRPDIFHFTSQEVQDYQESCDNDDEYDKETNVVNFYNSYQDKHKQHSKKNNTIFNRFLQFFKK